MTAFFALPTVATMRPIQPSDRSDSASIGLSTIATSRPTPGSVKDDFLPRTPWKVPATPRRLTPSPSSSRKAVLTCPACVVAYILLLVVQPINKIAL